MSITLILAGIACLIFAVCLVCKSRTPDTRLADAETYIRNHTLYRHYNIRGVQDILRGEIGSQGHIATISDSQVIEIVSRIRSERGLGPIAYYNLPE